MMLVDQHNCESFRRCRCLVVESFRGRYLMCVNDDLVRMFSKVEIFLVETSLMFEVDIIRYSVRTFL